MTRTASTHATRMLDARKTWYRVTTYDADGAFHSAEEAATMLGLDPRAVYKTLVVLRDGEPRAKPIVVMIPGPDELDLKTLAKAIGAKKLRMAPQREAERLTGMQAGGISVLGLQRPASFEILLDERARELETVHISAGARGVEIELRTEDLLGIAGARYVATTAGHA